MQNAAQKQAQTRPQSLPN